MLAILYNFQNFMKGSYLAISGRVSKMPAQVFLQDKQLATDLYPILYTKL